MHESLPELEKIIQFRNFDECGPQEVSIERTVSCCKLMTVSKTCIPSNPEIRTPDETKMRLRVVDPFRTATFRSCQQFFPKSVGVFKVIALVQQQALFTRSAILKLVHLATLPDYGCSGEVDHSS
jgi:hypothetical protein